MDASVKPTKISISTQVLPKMHDLRCEYTTDSAQALLESEYVLGVFGFAGKDSELNDPRYIDTGLTLIGSRGQREVWYSPEPVSFGENDDVRWASNTNLLLVSVEVSDCASNDDLYMATFKAYGCLLRVMAEHGCPHIVRAWNYFSGINSGEGDKERYKLFCSGRYDALVEADYDMSQFPAACALGHQGGPMVIYLLASSEPALNFENPQQRSAYHYPREYGPRAPSFARAALKAWSECAHVYISGTASIIGHQSIHPDCVVQQLEVTFENIGRLLDYIQRSIPTAPQLQASMLKVYLRNAGDYRLVKKAVEQNFGAEIKALYVEADVCRRELEVEIDGMCILPVTGL